MSELNKLLNMEPSKSFQLMMKAIETMVTTGVNLKVYIQNSDDKKKFYRKNSQYRRFRENAGQLGFILDEILKERSFNEPFFHPGKNVFEFSDAISKISNPQNFPLFFYPQYFDMSGSKKINFTINGESFSSFAGNHHSVINSIDCNSKLNSLDYFNPMELDINIKILINQDFEELYDEYEKMYLNFIQFSKLSFFDLYEVKNQSPVKEYVESSEFLRLSKKHPEIYKLCIRYFLGTDIEKINNKFNQLESGHIDKMINDYCSNKVFEANLIYNHGKSRDNQIFFK